MKKTIALFLIFGMLVCLLSSCVEPEVRETDPDTESPTTESAEPSEQPNDPTEEPTESVVEPTESEVEPTESEIEPTESEIEPTESEIEPTESEIEPTDSEIEPTESVIAPVESEIEPTESESEPTGSEPTEPEASIDDTTESESIAPDDFDDVCDEVQEGIFYNFDDFYVYATTGSRDPSSYNHSYDADWLESFEPVDPVALLKIEDLFDDKSVANQVDKIRLSFRPNEYTYDFKNWSDIRVRYDPELYDPSSYKAGFPNDNYEFVVENDANRFSPKSEEGTVYEKSINGATLFRRVEELRVATLYYFSTIIEGYEITIKIYVEGIGDAADEKLNDPDYQFAKAFWGDSDSELEGVIEKFKECILEKRNG